MQFGDNPERRSIVGDMYGHPCDGGCQLQRAQQMMMQAQDVLNRAARLAGRTENGEIVSQALWCDQGNHAFSARDPKSEHWERHVKNDDGETVTIPWDVCGPHLAGMGKSEPPAAVSLPAGGGGD